MKMFATSCVLLLSILASQSLLAQESEEIPELSTALSLFSANAGDRDIRVNWSLDTQSPTIVKFRLYRGYADAGHFAVLAEIPPHGGNGQTNYAYSDTLAIPGVTYFYKLGAVGQTSESVFPVVISAAVTPEGVNLGSMDDPVTILPGEKLELYVRRAGHVRLALSSSDKSHTIVDDDLTPGIYELEPPANGSLSFKLHHNDDFSRDLSWPLR